jgi:hypothetical protein
VWGIEWLVVLRSIQNAAMYCVGTVFSSFDVQRVVTSGIWRVHVRSCFVVL